MTQTERQSPERNAADIEREIAALWKDTNNPRIGLFAMRAIYARMYELRQELRALDKRENNETPSRCYTAENS